MTLQEAKEAKNRYGHSNIENGFEFLTLIVPSDFKEMIKFLADYNENNYTDDDCLKYSTDNDFKLYAEMSNRSRKDLTF